MTSLTASPVRALIFDLDGLLVDSEPVWFAVEAAFLARLGHTWTPADAVPCMGQGTPSTLRVWRERFGVEVDIERDTERMLDEVIARAREIPLRPGAAELLDWARAHGLVMGVASSSRRRLIEAVLAAAGVRSFFQDVTSGQDVARGKPAPDIFLLAASRLGVAAGACVVLEDALAGVRAARAAGMRVVAVPSVPGTSPELARAATAVASTLSEARRLLAPALAARG